MAGWARVVIVARLRFVNGLLAAGVLLAGAACTGVDQASASGVGTADAVAQLAGQLADSAALTYTATYRVAGGGTATVTRAQDPPRVAYRWPDGRLIVTPDGPIRCTGTRTCTITAPGGPVAAPPASSGVITSGAAQAMLRAAETQPALDISQRDTTLAARHVACLRVRWSFEVCVTGDGILAAFTGTVAGTELEMTLTDLTSAAGDGDFRIPPGADVTDRRPR